MASSRYPTIVVRRIPDMAVRIEKDGPVWSVIHDRPEARNAMDPESADALTAAFLEFDADKDACVAVFYGAGGAFCAGWDLKYVSTLDADYPLGELDISSARPRGNGGEIPRGPLGPSRLELDKPVIAAIEGPAVAGWMELRSRGGGMRLFLKLNCGRLLRFRNCGLGPGPSPAHRPTVQFQREAVGACSALVGELRQGRKARAGHRQSQPRDARGHDRYDALPREPVDE
jgi:Enoyl-CoA hydratase/isomerase